VSTEQDDQARKESEERLDAALAVYLATPESEKTHARPTKYAALVELDRAANPVRSGPRSEAKPVIDVGVQDKIMAMSAALAKLAPYGGTVWRACDLDASQATTYRVGDVVMEPAFVSATRDAQRYAPGPTTFAIASRNGKDISTMSKFPQDAEVVFDRGSLFLVLAVDTGTLSGESTVFLADLPRDLTPSDLSTLGRPSRELLVRLRADEDLRRAVSASERRLLNTLDKYTFPVGMGNDGILRRVVAGSGAESDS
jgi:hypothetical protein